MIRLYSHYNHYQHKSADDFHVRVVAEIKKHSQCRTDYSIRTCAYAMQHPNNVSFLFCVDLYLFRLLLAFTWLIAIAILCIATSIIYLHNLSKSHTQVSLHIGMYDVYTEDWLTVFPRHQLYFLKFEEFITNQMKHLNDVFSFLGLGK